MRVEPGQGTVRSQRSDSGVCRFVRAVRWRLQPEQEQGLLRIAIAFFALVYLLFSPPAGTDGMGLWLVWMQIALGYSIVLMAATLIWPEPSLTRRIVSVLGDIGVTTLALHLTGAAGAPWYGVYLWVTLGNGFRYGENYLYLSAVASLLGFGTVVLFTPYWGQQMDLAIGLAATLLVIPLYSGILIRRLNEARAQADSASRAKSDFLSRMSHEIRTPLNGILGMTDLLRTRPLDREEREYVEIIYASGKTLAHQIDEILDLAKIEAGQLSLEEIEFDLHALINTTLRIFEPQMHAKEIQLQEMINPKTPFLLYGDPHKLRQIIINLVGNAVKFTDAGFVSLRVFPTEQSDDRVSLRFEVADTGGGIPSDRLARIFDPFTQADSSVSRSHGGTGLGTTICKRVIELMGGEIGVQSTVGAGTTFWFDIPFATGKLQQPGTDHSWERDCNVVCLAAEQDPESSVTAALREWQIRFRSIKTTAEARACVGAAVDGAQSCDALLVVGMPYSEAMETLLSLLDAGKPGAAVPVVLIGADGYPPEIVARQHDHLFVLPSPVDKRVLFNTLHACYSRHSTEDDVIHIVHKQVREQHASRPLNILIGDDNATNRLVLQRMLKKMGHQCTAVNGGEAVLSALEHNSYDVAVVDKNMPDMSGIDVFSAYTLAHGGRTPTRFVILTADATAETRDKCMDVGIEYFLTKPVSLDRLRETFTSIAAGQATAHEPEDNEGTEQHISSFPVVDDEEFEKLQLLAGDDSHFMRDMVANFQKDADRDIRELEVAAAKRDWLAFKDAAHALKGAAMYLGLERLVALTIEAQILSPEEFEHSGIACIQSIRRATDVAIRTLHEKRHEYRPLPSNASR